VSSGLQKTEMRTLVQGRGRGEVAVELRLMRHRAAAGARHVAVMTAHLFWQVVVHLCRQTLFSCPWQCPQCVGMHWVNVWYALEALMQSKRTGRKVQQHGVDIVDPALTPGNTRLQAISSSAKVILTATGLGAAVACCVLHAWPHC
jgi:hypothetical protein